MSREGSVSDKKYEISDGIAERLAEFGGHVVRVVEKLPETGVGNHVRDQLFRSAVAPGAHYAEARCAQSRDDFIHKVSLAAKEAREARHWLRIVEHSGFLERTFDSVIDEADELVAILFSSLQTAREGGSN